MNSIFKSIPLMQEIEHKVLLPYPENYGIYQELIENGTMTIDLHTAFDDIMPMVGGSTYSIGLENHINWVINIFKDGIEVPYIQHLKINVIFADGYDVNLNLVDYLYNLFFWNMMVLVGEKVTSRHLFFEEAINKKAIKKYIDRNFINVFKKKVGLLGATPEEVNFTLNRIIDACLGQFFKLDNFSFYLADTINLEDDIILMNQSKEYYDCLHADLSNVPIEDVQNVGMEIANKAINILKGTDHCLADSFKAGQGINPKQFKEYAINIGTVPDGNGSVFPTIINSSFINGGTNTTEYQLIESSKGRTAQILAKCNVGTSGNFARLLGLNNREGTILHHDPVYDCHSANPIRIVIRSEQYLEMFEGRYYRLSPNGMEHQISLDDKHLIGQTIYLRSPMTCASHARGRGICYKCYSDLAYTNSSLNIGQLASELLSAALTQRLLSAKHLLESKVKKMNWSHGFEDIFNVELNIITLHEDADYEGWKMIIDPEDISYESEEDEFEYNEYISRFTVQAPNGMTYDIHTENYDSIYLSDDINKVIRQASATNNDMLEIDMTKLQDGVVFLLNITNIEYSDTLNKIKAIINKEAETTSYDIHGILQQFVDTIISGKLDISAVHLEVILSNQIRHPENILMNPEWDSPNAAYRLITLNKALTDNPSITVSMSYQKLSKVLYNPLSFNKTGATFLDLLFHKNPQELMMNKSLLSDDYKPKSDVEEAKPLFRFMDKDDSRIIPTVEDIMKK